ncbi:MAG: restriction endonuclease [Sphingobium sp.]|nr:restriction endonuclease [Sphingobium sp.]
MAAVDPAAAKSGVGGGGHSHLWIFVIALILIGLLARRMRGPASHRWRRRQARTMNRQLSGRDRDQPPGFVFARLRGMDPLAFEELLLECFERRGCKVVRNTRYTGDGGLDGQVVIQGQTWLIQAKRYATSIRPEHVDAFAALCRARKVSGLFIHTGRTGPTTRALVERHDHIEIISGERLLALIHGGAIMIRGMSL